MKKQLAERIIQSFDFKTMEVLKEYVDYRIALHHKFLETSNTLQTPELQGKVSELRTLLKIRDDAVAILALRT